MSNTSFDLSTSETHRLQDRMRTFLERALMCPQASSRHWDDLEQAIKEYRFQADQGRLRLPTLLGKTVEELFPMPGSITQAELDARVRRADEQRRR